MNLISTKWEEFRLNLFNSDTFKNILDIVSELLDKINNLDLGKILLIGTAFLTIGRQAIVGIVLGMQSGAKLLTKGLTTLMNTAANSAAGSMSSVLDKVVSKFGKGKKIQLQIEALEKNVLEVKQKIYNELTNSGQLKLDIDSSSVDVFISKLEEARSLPLGSSEWKTAMKDLANQCGLTTTELGRIIVKYKELQLDGKLDPLLNDLDSANQKIELQLQSLNSISTEALSEGFKSAAASATVLVTALMTGSSVGEAFKASLVSLAVTTVSSMMSAIGATLAEKAATDSLTLSEIAATVAAEALLAVLTFGIGLAITGIVVGIVALVKAIGNLLKAEDSEAEKWKKKAKYIEETNEKYQEYLSTVKSDAKDVQETADTSESNYEVYTKLKNKTVLTDDEQEEWDSMIEDLLENNSNLITYYNEETGELRVQESLWESLIEKQKESARLAQIWLDNVLASSDALLYLTDIYSAYSKVSDATGLSEYTIERLVNGDLELKDNISTVDNSGIKLYLEEFLKYFENGEYYGQGNELSFLDFMEVANDALITGEDINHNSIVTNLDYASSTAEAAIGATYGAYIQSEIENNGGIDINGEWITDINDVTYDMIASMSLSSEVITEAMEGLKQTLNDLNDTYKDTAILNSKNFYEDYYNEDGYEATEGELFVAGGFIENTTGENSTAKAVAAELADDTDNIQIEITEDREKGIFDSSAKFSTDDGKVAGYSLEEYQDALIEIYGSESAAIEALEELGKEILNTAAAYLDFLKDAEEANGAWNDLDSTLQNQISLMYSNLLEDGITDSSFEKLNTYLTSVKVFTPELVNNMLKEYSDALNQVNNELKEVGLNKVVIQIEEQDGEELDVDQKEQLITYRNTFVDLGADEDAVSEFLSELFSDALAKGLTTDETMSLMVDMDLTNVSLENLNDTKEAILNAFEEAGEEENFDEFWENFLNSFYSSGVYDLTLDSIGALTEIDSSMKTQLDSIVDSAGTAASAIQEALTNGFINYSLNRELEDSLSELGLDINDYTSYDESLHGYVVDAEALEQAYYDMTNDLGMITEMAKQLILATIDELESENDILIGLRDLIKAKSKLVSLTADQAKLAYEIAGIEADDPEYFQDAINNLESVYGEDYGDEFLSDINQAIIDNEEVLAEWYEFYDEETDTWNDEKLAEYIDSDAYKAAGYESEAKFIAAYEAAEADTEADEYEEKLEAVEDAEESLLEALEKLNDALEDYNELLYGSDNRKSSLDNLYNYTEAINSYTNAATRAKDALGDASTIEEATEAWQDYAEAYHNVIAYNTAELSVIEEALGNYADWIENATSSYTDTENGNTITVNYSDYVSYDENTGKYVLDLQLLNQAEFNDSYKELLETLVSNYNKYADELLSLQDEVAKAEEELQEAREQAYKDYASMEDEIASILKEKYQDEIDALKEKYESMEEADSDYYDALKEAIDKQRELRDLENEYEDLAQQERKLALMLRDTSGANQTEVMELEDEVEESRLDLLDEEVDNILDSMKEANDNLSELHDTEIELKEAILDNTAYWNSLAEQIAASFTSTDDYVEWMTENSTEFIESTMTKLITLMNDWTDTATNALVKYAIDGSDTIENYVTVTSDEVATIVNDTGEALTSEVTRQANETTTLVTEDLEAAINSIDDARKSVTDAEEALAEAKAALDAFNDSLSNTSARAYDETDVDSVDSSGSSTHTSGSNSLLDYLEWGTQSERKDLLNKLVSENDQYSQVSDITDLSTNVTLYGSEISTEELIALVNDITDKEDLISILGAVGSTLVGTTAGYNTAKAQSAEELQERIQLFLKGDPNAYASGGLVDYTGPAWVDGTPSSPEAFLSAEDTERIGRAAEILADLPLLNSTSTADNINSTSYGDTTIEINLNIDSISSDVDIDNMIDLMKQEIVDAANPVGSSNILTKSY